MDIFAHGLWVGVGIAVTRCRWPLAPRTVAATVALAMLPDLAHTLPIIAWATFGDGAFAALYAYALALPGEEPALPSIVALLAHHLHCIFHSALIAGAVTLLLWGVLRALWMPLLGWWSHILIDVFTHSIEFYPAPLLYPITQQGIDGLAWNTPWFMAFNYTALSAAYLWLLRSGWREGGP